MRKGIFAVLVGYLSPLFFTRCNLVAACENNVDELGCSDDTHFYCDGNETFIPQSLIFDGNFDCKDFTDECGLSSTSVSTPTHLIGNVVLQIFLWIQMLLSIIGNGMVTAKTGVELYNALRRRLHNINRVGVCNKVMILNLAVSDFLMGCYLLLIIVKSLQFSGKYCSESIRWLKGNGCAFAGVLAVVSSQTSVMLMVLITTYRLYCIKNPFRAEKIRDRMVYFATIIIWLISLLLATVPLFPSLKNKFATALVIIQPYGSNRLSIQQLRSLTKTANQLPGLNLSIPEESELSVRTFCNLFINGKTMPSYCDNQTSADDNVIGYYGSDGVCLPRFYGKSEEHSSIYSFGIVCLNFAAFLYILIAYLFTYRSTSMGVQHSDTQNGSTDEVRLRENQALWFKISRLIVTDFICWVPICIMSIISFAGGYLPDEVYQITAVILIPINSAVNPWLYSSLLPDYVKKLKQTRFVTFCSGNRLRRNTSTNESRPMNWFEKRKKRKSSVEQSTNSFSLGISMTTGFNSVEPSMVATTQI